MSNPAPGTPAWQQWLNEEIAKHDDQFAKDNPNWDDEHGSDKKKGGK